MKKKLYIFILGIIGTFTLGSCSDWFDISPKTDVKAQDLYETENGFMSSLAGIYILMTTENSYGTNMTFGLLDQLAQMYDNIPEGAVDKISLYNYTQNSSGYNTKGRMEDSWLASYNIIANANNLLKWLDQKGETVISNENKRNMLRGEALAIRAYLHFDLLRCWGPMNYAENTEARSTKCIPYRTATDKSKQPLLPAEEIVNRVIADLDSARNCLSYEKDQELGNYNINGDRRFRFNYHAINAVLARVHNYAGNKEKAKTFANEVINTCGLSLQNSNDGDPILSKEILCGIHLYQMSNYMSNYFENDDKIQTKYHITFTTMNNIFEITGTESEDMRAKSTAILRNNDLQRAVSNKYIRNDNEIIPLIRLPEMYYILCENSEGEEAAYYINTVRNKRGISSSNNVVCNTEQERINALNREYRKEFYAEGQYFLFLKSHGMTGTIDHMQEISLSEEHFIFPLPDREKEYGWTEEETSTEEEPGEETENN